MVFHEKGVSIESQVVQVCFLLFTFREVVWHYQRKKLVIDNAKCILSIVVNNKSGGRNNVCCSVDSMHSDVYVPCTM